VSVRRCRASTGETDETRNVIANYFGFILCLYKMTKASKSFSIIQFKLRLSNVAFNRPADARFQNLGSKFWYREPVVFVNRYLSLLSERTQYFEFTYVIRGAESLRI
jgi:hypothetical protein